MTPHYTITSQILQGILDITQLLTRLEFVQEHIASLYEKKVVFGPFIHFLWLNTTQQASQLTGKSLATARRNLAQLVAEGLLVATGQNRNRKYGLAEKNN